MTWNVLTDAATHAPPWSARLPVLARRVAELAPSVLGTQEASAEMLSDLLALLPDRYRWVGEGRLGTGRGETCAVVYDGASLSVLDVRNRWLSATPLTPGSKEPDADLPRLLTAVHFHDHESGSGFTVVNTHADHLGAQARLVAADLVSREAQVGPAVVMGDFNAPAESSAPYQVLRRAGLVDALSPRDRRERRLRTFAGVRPRLGGDGEQIDWLLVTPDVTVGAAWVDDPVAVHDVAPSDHRPVVADLVLPER